MSSFVASAAANATTLTLPSHQAGDMLLMFVYGAVTPPAGWDQRGDNASGAIGGFYTKEAQSSSEVSGTWTGATRLICGVWRPEAGCRFTFGATAVKQTGTSNTATISGLTLIKTNTLSSVVGMMISSNPGSGAAGSMNDRTPATFAKGIFDVINQSTFTSKTAATGSLTANWATWAYELDEVSVLLMTGTAAFNFTAPSDIVAEKLLTGTMAATFTVSGSVIREWLITGAPSVTFSMSGTIVPHPVLSGEVPFRFEGTGELLVEGGWDPLPPLSEGWDVDLTSNNPWTIQSISTEWER